MSPKSMSLTIILLILKLCSTENVSCDQYMNEQECLNDIFDACKWDNSASTFTKCQCTSASKLDILFGIEVSDHYGATRMHSIKQFISSLITQGINDNFARIGFTIFATEVNVSRTIQTWDANTLQNYVNGLVWTGGYSNVPALLSSALTQFSNTKENDREQILMIITVLPPCVPDSCPTSVCQYATSMKSAGIKTVIIGIGDKDWAVHYECLLQSTDDLLISGAAMNDLGLTMASIMNPLSDVFCPFTTTVPSSTPTIEPTSTTLTQTLPSQSTNIIGICSQYTGYINSTISIQLPATCDESDTLIIAYMGDLPHTVDIVYGEHGIDVYSSNIYELNQDYLCTNIPMNIVVCIDETVNAKRVKNLTESNHFVDGVNRVQNSTVIIKNITVIKIAIVYINEEEIKNETISFLDGSYNWFIPLFAGLLLVMICAAIHKACSNRECGENRFYKDPFHAIDNVNYLKVIFFAFQLLDVGTDWNFIYDILYTQMNTANIIVAFVSVFFIVLSTGFNIYALYKIKCNDNNLELNQFVHTWLNQATTSRYFALFVLLSGSLYHSIELANSNLFGHNIFLCPLTFSDYPVLTQIKFKHLILMENIPQIITQSLWLLIFNHDGNKISLIVYISIGLSVINCMSFVLEYCFNKNNNRQNQVFSFQFILRLDDDIDVITDDKRNILYKQYFTHSIKKAIISAQLFNNDNNLFDVNRIYVDKNNVYFCGVISIDKKNQQTIDESRVIHRQSTSGYNEHFSQIVNAQNIDIFIECVAYDVFDLESKELSVTKINIDEQVIYQNIYPNDTNECQMQSELTAILRQNLC